LTKCAGCGETIEKGSQALYDIKLDEYFHPEVASMDPAVTRVKQKMDCLMLYSIENPGVAISTVCVDLDL